MENKIGGFIQQSRKAKGLTQKDLGDQIGVSDKTISKWENGNSIPDTTILTALCHSLDVTVNELLSGETLAPETYSQKAEENIMQLLQEQEKNKKSTLLTYIIGLLLLAASFGAGIFSNAWEPDILSYWDVPSLFLFLCMCFALTLLSGKHGKKERISFLRKIVIPVGALCTTYELIHFLHSLTEPAQCGPIAALCMLSLSYACIAYLILFIWEQHLKG